MSEREDLLGREPRRIRPPEPKLDELEPFSEFTERMNAMFSGLAVPASALTRGGSETLARNAARRTKRSSN